MSIPNCVLDIVTLLDRLGMVRGYGCSRTGRPYTCGEDLMWDIAATEWHVGETLEVLDAKRYPSEIHRIREEERRLQEILGGIEGSD